MAFSRQVYRAAARLNAKVTAATKLPSPRRQPLASEAAVPLRFSNRQAAVVVNHSLKLWNMLIPACALRPEVGPTHTTFAHPTKGPRSIANRRLGIAPALAA